LIPLIFDAAGTKTEIEYLPGRSVDVPRVQLDVSRIASTLGWKPRTSMEEGLRLTVSWIREAALGREPQPPVSTITPPPN
jgi:nucleoside-diphosphate-sugar epimerase